ncbi:hypothetical protein GGQ74_003048 [Desulfobaculum xiamenense]|uniref:Uncharacterized protein n=1 Tax=Desulfobaculum xiamenense TaxID=995050 RepID=A0A846QKA0_9BACT|nr:hypothetical protein [Desulfobaculum xiamenense]NJB69346.1 hypothetical protein [Desulfobaculum xiamenense]
MIVIDGRETGLSVNNFANLEELLVRVMEDENLDNRMVTDVIVNKEPFSEIYPHQAEDIPSGEIESVEIVTMAVPEMAVNITRELYKVVRLMAHGSRTVADLFRQADDAEALELYQDLLDVTRDFLGMIAVLRDEFGLRESQELNDSLEEITSLFTEMIEVSENEDWILLADLLEYEFLTAVEKWKGVIAQLREDIRQKAKAA